MNVAGIRALAISLALTFAATVRAEPIDMNVTSCKTLLQLGAKDPGGMGNLVHWLYGWKVGQAGKTVLDSGGFEDLTKQLVKICGANPSLGLIAAAKQTTVN